MPPVKSLLSDTPTKDGLIYDHSRSSLPRRSPAPSAAPSGEMTKDATRIAA